MPILVLMSSYAAFSLFRALVLIRLRELLKRKGSAIGDALIKALHGPIRLFMGIGIIAITAQTFPSEYRNQPALIYGIKIGLIAGLIWIISRMARIIVKKTELIPIEDSNRSLILFLFRLILISTGGLIILDTLGISITPILASLGVGSIAVALALQDTLGNLFSGIYLLLDKPIRVGDSVSIEDTVTGMIVKIGWRSTHVRLLNDNTVIIPNSKIVNARITNYDYPDSEMALTIQASVSYESDLDHVERVTKEVAKEVLSRVEGGVPSVDSSVRFHTFGDSSVNFNVSLRIKQFSDQFLIKHEFIKALYKRYRLENISIPFPQRVIHLHGKNSSLPS